MRVVGTLVVLYSCLFHATPVLAAAKVALVIGNSAYENVGALPNPENDAADLAAALERIGFTVTLANNLDFDGMRGAMKTFSGAATGSDIAIIYFAGHGIEVNKQNYLIPVDAHLADERNVQLEAISLEWATGAVAGAKNLKLVILDACRNNPFIAQITRSGGSTRSIGRGLANVEPLNGTLVAYSARDGTTAEDGDGRNSPFARSLLAHIEEPGLDVELMFRRVRDDVLKATASRQEPFTYGSLPGTEVHLVPPKVAELPPEPVRDTREEDFAWELAKESDDPDALRRYIRTFPDGGHVEAAFKLLEERTAAALAARPDTEVAALPPATDATGAYGMPAIAPAPAVQAEPETEIAVLTPDEPTPEPEATDPKVTIRAIQQILSDAACKPGPVDGDWGARSRRALSAFGSAAGLKLDGEPNEALLKTLRSYPNVTCVAPEAPAEPVVASTGPEPDATPAATSTPAEPAQASKGKSVGLTWDSCGGGSMGNHNLPPAYYSVPAHRAIASSNGEGCGVSWSFPSVSEAEAAAMAQCQKRGRKCRVTFAM